MRTRRSGMQTETGMQTGKAAKAAKTGNAATAEGAGSRADVPDTLDAAVLEKLISAAVAAPSIHNTQPWRYRLDTDTATVEVWADTARALPALDPAGRALHLSVGAAVFNLRVAVAHFGWEPVVRLLPRPAEPRLLACVRPAGARPRHEAWRPELYEAVGRRHSSRLPFSDRPVPDGLRAELAAAARAEGALLEFPDAEEIARVLELTAEGERLGVANPRRAAESRRWVKDGAGDGLPAAALGPHDAESRLPVRDFAGLRPSTPRRPAVPFERRPVIAVLATPHDARADWLRAGQALEHVLLVATARGLRSSLLHQAVEWPDIRWALRDVRSGPQHVQMLIRLGYGPEGAPTPRRPVAAVLDTR